MKIVYLHFHLKTGGVTTVLKTQVSTVQPHCDTLVLTGDRSSTVLPCPIVEIPEIGYDTRENPPANPDRVADSALRAIHSVWPGGCDILHIHNPTLAKNRHLLAIIKRLQQSGTNLFLQIHDFAEDGRPGAYFYEDYPENCHYGVINAKDARILEAAGLKKAGLHLLPNAVESILVPERLSVDPQILYPVRAIRRKNVGEALLLSLFLRRGQRLAITQPPNSPMDIASYRDWMDWSNMAGLPVDFEIGINADFPSLVGSAESMVTTSITEGFGLAFLEPWTAGKLLWGRRIEGLCVDFEKNGGRLDTLYDRLNVPLHWIDINAFSRVWHKTVRDASARFGHAIGVGKAETAFTRMTRGGQVDFGLLNEKFQREVLTRMTADPSAKMALIEQNSWLAKPGVAKDPVELIRNNRLAIQQHYNTEQYGRRLLEIYHVVACQPVRHRIDRAVLVDAFFDLNHFSLLKWGGYEK